MKNDLHPIQIQEKVQNDYIYSKYFEINLAIQLIRYKDNMMK